MEKNTFVEFKLCICDAPARAYLKSIKGHTGYSGCERGIQKGKYVQNRMTFPEIKYVLRTDDNFREQIDERHHSGISQFLKLPNFDMVHDFPLDYMHLVCLGVMKKMLKDMWSAGKLPHCFTQRDKNEINKKN